MSQNAFAITTTTQELTLEPGGKGSIIFTVFNSSGHAILPARAEILAENSDAQDWITSEEDGSHKNFAVGGTQQYRFDIQVPDGATGGRYGFHLNMIGIENPDEDFTQGPSIHVIIPGQEEKPAESPRIPWLWIALGTVAFIIVAGLLIWQLTKNGGDPGEEVTLQSYKGALWDQVEMDLQGLGFVVDLKRQSNNNYGKNIVFDQDPGAGSYPKGSTVTVYVSNDPKIIKLENYYGKKWQAAYEALEAKGFKVLLKDNPDSDRPLHTVVHQEPAGNSYQPEGSMVTLTVSKINVNIYTISPVMRQILRGNLVTPPHQ